MSKTKQEKKLYEGEKFEAFLNFLDSIRKGENAVFTDTDTGQRIFTQSAVNQQVLKALGHVKSKQFWAADGAYDAGRVVSLKDIEEIEKGYK